MDLGWQPGRLGRQRSRSHSVEPPQGDEENRGSEEESGDEKESNDEKESSGEEGSGDVESTLLRSKKITVF